MVSLYWDTVNRQSSQGSEGLSMKAGFLLHHSWVLMWVSWAQRKHYRSWWNNGLVCGTKGPESLDLSSLEKVAPCVLPEAKTEPLLRRNLSHQPWNSPQAWEAVPCCPCSQVSGVLDPQSQPRETQAHGQMRRQRGQTGSMPQEGEVLKYLNSAPPPKKMQGWSKCSL